MRLLATIIATLLLLSPSAGPRAAPLVADLSSHLIAITTAFAGSDVLLFGAAEDEGEVVVVVRGPAEDVTVRRKARTAGIWINRDEMMFEDAPRYYAVASTAPIDEIAQEIERARHEIGLDKLRLRPDSDGAARTTEEIASFRSALIRNKQRDGLYTRDVGRVAFVGGRLFRTTLHFPANVVPGSYQVQVFQFQDGEVASAQSSVLVVSKVGLEAELFDFAHEQAPLYGMIAVLIAIASGWLAAVAFRKP